MMEQVDDKSPFLEAREASGIAGAESVGSLGTRRAGFVGEFIP